MELRLDPDETLFFFSDALLDLQGERYHANYLHEQSGVLLHRQGETAIKTIIICCSEIDPPPTSVNDPGLLFHVFYLVLDTHHLLQELRRLVV
jgi:hypothetical protein